MSRIYLGMFGFNERVSKITPTVHTTMNPPLIKGHLSILKCPLYLLVLPFLQLAARQVLRKRIRRNSGWLLSE